MKILSVLALFSTLLAPIAGSAVGLGPSDTALDCTVGMKLMMFKVTVMLEHDNDNTWDIFDNCADEVVGTVVVGTTGTTTAYYCLNPWRTYTFQIRDFAFPVDTINDEYTLMWGDDMIIDQQVLPLDTGTEFTFGTECGGGGTGDGDPHFKTHTGRSFDFHAACDLVLMSAPEFNNGLGLDIHVRTKSRYQYSFIESAAIKVGDDILEVSSWGENFFNGVDGAKFPTTMGGVVPVVHKEMSKKQHIFELDIGGDQQIILKTFKDMVGVHLTPRVSIFGKGISGMLGQFNATMDMVSRDGKTLIEEPNAYGEEWQVRDFEPKLFQNVDHFPQYPQPCVYPKTTSEERRRLGEMSITEEQAMAACKTAGRVEDMDACVYDVIATGDLEMASAGAF